MLFASAFFDRASPSQRFDYACYDERTIVHVVLAQFSLSRQPLLPVFARRLRLLLVPEFRGEELVFVYKFLFEAKQTPFNLGTYFQQIGRT